MTDKLEIVYMPLGDLKRFKKNAKNHDLGKIAESIAHYGYKDAMKLEPSLNDGTGGIVEGNGRLESLLWMKAQGQAVPRGIIEKDGEWMVPVTVGVDATDELEAQAYSLDHNNLSLLGGDLTALDAASMYDSEAYLELLVDLSEKGEKVVGVDGNDLDLLLKTVGEVATGDPYAEWGSMPEYEQENDDYYKTIKVRFLNDIDYSRFAQLVEQPLTDKTRSITYPRVSPMDIKSMEWHDES